MLRIKLSILTYKSLDWEEPLEEEMATHSSIPPWRIPWTKEAGGVGSQRVRHAWATDTHTHQWKHLWNWRSHLDTWHGHHPAELSWAHPLTPTTMTLPLPQTGLAFSRTSNKGNQTISTFHDSLASRFVLLQGFPGGSEVKASTPNAGDQGAIPGSGRSPGEENGNPLQHSCPENPMDRGAW